MTKAAWKTVLQRGIFIFAMCAAGAVSAARTLIPVRDGPAERTEFSAAVRKLFEAEEFELLERMADKLWKEQTRFVDGTWKLAAYFQAFEMSSTDKARYDWDGAWARFGRWRAQRSDSKLAPILHARMLVSWAWAARGSGFADTVSEKGWGDFGARLAEARAILDADPALKEHIGYYYAMMPIALGQGWPRKEMEQVFAGAVKLAPDFEAVYFGKATFLQTKWYGRPGDWQKFAEEAAGITRAQHGDVFFARVVWSVLTVRFNGRWPELGVDWPHLKRGFEDLMKETPDSKWNLSAFCYYACRAEDWATAAQLFDQLGDTYAAGIWRTPEAFENFRRIAKKGGRP